MGFPVFLFLELADFLLHEVHAFSNFFDPDRGELGWQKVVFFGVQYFILHVDGMVYVGSAFLEVDVVDVFFPIAVGSPFGVEFFGEAFLGEEEIVDFKFFGSVENFLFGRLLIDVDLLHQEAAFVQSLTAHYY